MNVLFTVRQIYFDQIVPGLKTNEVRRESIYWERIVGEVQRALHRSEPVTAIFVCGRLQHRRRITGVARFETAFEALGREPSEQGKKDIGEGPVFSFKLGEIVQK